MKYFLTLLCLIQTWAFAQGMVNVNNRGLTPTPWEPRIVMEPNGNPLIGTNYVAQILYGASSSEMTNELGAVMPFRASYNSTTAGTWNPSPQPYRILNGFAEGQTAWMIVYVWDPAFFPTWRDVPVQRNLGDPPTMVGRSNPFPFTVGSTNTIPAGITGFSGITLTRLGWPTPPTETILIPEGGDGTVTLAPVDTFWWHSEFVSVINVNGSYHITSRPGDIGQAAQATRLLPNLCLDGPNYGFASDGFCTAPPRFQGISVVVQPSPRRPFLDFSRSNSVPALTLRGLPPTRYRLESSTNLHGWTSLGDLTLGETGNAPVPPEWLSTNSTQFIRFSPLP